MHYRFEELQRDDEGVSGGSVNTEFFVGYIEDALLKDDPEPAYSLSAELDNERSRRLASERVIDAQGNRFSRIGALFSEPDAVRFFLTVVESCLSGERPIKRLPYGTRLGEEARWLTGLVDTHLVEDRLDQGCVPSRDGLILWHAMSSVRADAKRLA